MKTKKVIIILTVLILGTITPFLLDNIDPDARKIFYNIIIPLVSGVSLVLISVVIILKSSERINNSQLLKFLNKFKILFLVVGFISLIVFSFNIVLFFEQPKSNSKGWDEELIDKEIKDCIKSVPDLSKQYPKQTHDYCECVINKVKDTISYKEYIDSLKNPTPSGILKLTPLIQSCIDAFQKAILEKKSQIDSIEKK